MTDSGLDEFIPLDRTFHSLVHEEGANDDVDLRRHFGRQDAIRWENLLPDYRVVVLSEAGSGKTAEIRNIAADLRRSGKQAFFVRIEHAADDFETAFEIGTLEEFEVWVASGEEGWLLLDSVDEARLRDPKDFERAIRKVSKRIGSAVQNAHIVITGRISAWRPKTDLLLCRAAFPFDSAEHPRDEEPLGAEGEPEMQLAPKPGAPSDFRLVALDDLRGEQVDRFLVAKGVTDLVAFKAAVERKEAWSFTTRPQDLSELVGFWMDYGRIGSRLELMRSSIGRRLEERDQDRADARPITTERIRLGARLVAATATLTQESAIRVPDGSENAQGLSVKEVLTDWDDQDCAILLSRPIFDEGIYGTVRFHHRSVREYLTAEWLHELIVDQASRARIEGLFFRTQYGIEIVVPTMRPILPWLAILDDRILARVISLAPEILFEGGDPSQLPRDTRCQVLRQACEHLSQPAHGRSVMDYAAVQRFVSTDLTDEVKVLLARYGEDEDIAWFLLRMIDQGELKDAAEDAKQFAILSRSEYTRIAAFRAVQAVGSDTDREAIRAAFLKEKGDIQRSWLAELLPGLPSSVVALKWLLKALARAAPKQRFETDSLSSAMGDYVSRAPMMLMKPLIEGLKTLLDAPPVVESHIREVSVRNGWLAQAAAMAVARAAEVKSPVALEGPSLSILRSLPLIQEFGDSANVEIKTKLPELVKQWPALNQALFWADVEAARRGGAGRKPGEAVTGHWQVGIFGHYWSFSASDLDAVCEDIVSRHLSDDKAVATTLAFTLYVQSGRPPKLRSRLKRIAGWDPVAASALQSLLHPSPGQLQKWRRQEAGWKRRAAAAAAKAAAARAKSKEYLLEHMAELRDPCTPGIISSAQHYLHQSMRDESDRSNRWTEGRWRTLIPEFGEAIAQAFRDGAVGYWRTHRPQLQSEGAAPNSTPFSVIFGLTGLAIESDDQQDWSLGLTAQEADTATRYALHELNGFPPWLPGVYRQFPDPVIDLVVQEIAFELKVHDEKAESHYVLYDASWSGEWMWDHLGPVMLKVLRKTVKSLGDLQYLLTIVQGASIEGATLAKLAAQKAASRNPDLAPTWFAVWVGVDPVEAIPAITARLATIRNPDEQTAFAMRFVTQLMGGRRGGRGVRQAYRSIDHMKALYLLTNEFVRERDDINRAGKGVYSPGLRDDAQDARGALFSFIRETPGKAAYLALAEISRAHPEEKTRPWMAFHAKEKAALDADAAPWTPSQVRGFNDDLERTPANHRDLWYLAVDRLADLKMDLEEGDSSIADILQPVDQETQIRKYIGNWCREHSGGHYSIPQEEELADAKRPDLRFHGFGFDSPVPAELKLADKWTGPHLFERLEVQLCGDYLRDRRSSRGIFTLVYHGTKSSWDLPNGGKAEGFMALVEALQNHWLALAPQFPGVEDIRVIGIDLTKRGLNAETAKAARKSRRAEKSGIAKDEVESPCT